LISSVANGFNCFGKAARELDEGGRNVDVGEEDEQRLFDTVLDGPLGLGIISRAADAMVMVIQNFVEILVWFWYRVNGFDMPGTTRIRVTS
jgi:hypothetical protein